MKVLTLTFPLVLCVVFLVRAQNPTPEGFSRIEKHLQQRNLDSALLAVTALEEQLQNQTDSQKSEAYYKLGKLFMNTPRPDLAEKHLQKSWGIASVPTLKIDALDALAQACYLQGKLQKAINYAHGSRFLSEKYQRTEAVPNTYSNLGMIHEDWANYDSAYFFHNEALKGYITQDTLSLRVVNGYKHLGVLHKNTTNYKEAEKCYEAGLAVLKALKLSGTKDHADLYYNLGNVFREQKQLHKAKRYFTYSLNIEKKILPPEHPSRAYTLTNLGLIEDNLGNTRKAIEYFEHTLTIYKSAFGEVHPAVGGTLSNLAGAFGDLGELDKAYSYYKEALTIFKQVFGEKHPAVAGVSRNLAALYLDHEEDEAGTYWLDYSQGIHEAIYSPTHIDYIEILYQRAVHIRSPHQLDSGLLLIQKALWHLAGEATPSPEQLSPTSFPALKTLDYAEYTLKVLELKAEMLQQKKQYEATKTCFTYIGKITDQEIRLNITDLNDKIAFVERFALENFKSAAYFHFREAKKQARKK